MPVVANHSRKRGAASRTSRSCAPVCSTASAAAKCSMRASPAGTVPVGGVAVLVIESLLSRGTVLEAGVHNVALMETGDPSTPGGAPDAEGKTGEPGAERPKPFAGSPPTTAATPG